MGDKAKRSGGPDRVVGEESGETGGGGATPHTLGGGPQGRAGGYVEGQALGIVGTEGNPCLGRLDTARGPVHRVLQEEETGPRSTGAKCPWT